jgi:hypothetical protein
MIKHNLYKFKNMIIISDINVTTYFRLPIVLSGITSIEIKSLTNSVNDENSYNIDSSVFKQLTDDHNQRGYITFIEEYDGLFNGTLNIFKTGLFEITFNSDNLTYITIINYNQIGESVINNPDSIYY